MPVRTETLAAVRPVPYLLQVAVPQTIECPVRHGATGALQAPLAASSRITITRPDGTDLVSAATVAVPSSTAQYTLTPSAAETPGGGWLVRWSLSIAGDVYQYQYEAYLCERVPTCPISVADLYVRMPELRHRVPQAQTEDRGDGSGWQPQVDAVYYELIQRLLDDGEQPWLYRSMVGARQWMVPRAVEVCLRAIDPTGDKYEKQATSAMYEARNAYAGLRFAYETESASLRRGVGPLYRLAPVGRPVI